MERCGSVNAGQNQLAKTPSKSRNPLILIEFSAGSRKNIVHCSPGSSSYRTVGGITNVLPPQLEQIASVRTRSALALPD